MKGGFARTMSYDPELPAHKADKGVMAIQNKGCFHVSAWRRHVSAYRRQVSASLRSAHWLHSLAQTLPTSCTVRLKLCQLPALCASSRSSSLQSARQEEQAKKRTRMLSRCR